MADDIEADDFTAFDFGCEYGSEAASVEFTETGKRNRDSQDSFEFSESTTAKKKRKKQRTNKISKFIKDRDQTQAIRSSPMSEQVIFLQRQFEINPIITGRVRSDFRWEWC